MPRTICWDARSSLSLFPLDHSGSCHPESDAGLSTIGWDLPLCAWNKCLPARSRPSSERPDKLSQTFFMQLIFHFFGRRPPGRANFSSRVYLALLALGVIFASQHGAQSASTIADAASVESFTGGHTRVVWVTDAQNKDSFAARNQLQLVGYDSRDGKGERIICPERANYYRPLITPDGEQIVFSNLQNHTIYAVKWDGSGRRILKAPGSATEVWRDPATGKTWVYYQESHSDFSRPVRRFLIDDPKKVEIVWSSSIIQALPSFQLSRDGKMAASTFPWPSSGVAELPNVAWRKHRDGCWPAMAPDDSYLSWTFDGPHRNLFMTRAGEKESWKINISNAPGVNDYEVYHPRWTNDVRYMVMTGPYTSGPKKIKLWDGGDNVEIYLGKFNKEFRDMEGWFRLTTSRTGEFFPDVWIAGGENHSSNFKSHAAVPPADKPSLVETLKGLVPEQYESKWPGTRKGLLFEWRDNKDNNQFVDGTGKLRNVRLKAEGGARFGPNGEMHIIGGSFVPDGTFNKEIRDACKESDQIAIEAIVTTSRVPQFGPARIISLSRNSAKRNFTFAQDGDSLALRLQTSNTSRNGMDFKLASIQPGILYHVIVTYKRGLLVCYLNGKIANQTKFEKGSFDKWHGSSYSLIFGNEVGGVRPWEGYLDSVAIYSRFIDADEAVKKFELAGARIAERPKIERKVVKAEMLHKVDSPPVEAITPYRRALVINRYRVREASDSTLVNQTVQVAEWALLDAKIPMSYARAKPGEIREMNLEPYDAHPQLESERLASEMPSLDEEVYYSVSSGH
jgi:Concanavalin A-like lectin/glucanases superfamily